MDLYNIITGSILHSYLSLGITSPKIVNSYFDKELNIIYYYNRNKIIIINISDQTSNILSLDINGDV